MDDIMLVDYDPAWPAMYEAEAARVASASPFDLFLAIERFGSTAIPGMVAKPIIDLVVAVRSIPEPRDAAVRPMEALGYAFWADNPRHDRLFLVKGLPPAAPHALRPHDRTRRRQVAPPPVSRLSALRP
jgi:GrpB-like predicted nucleotidyltransferase (UPF0157 family)